MTEQPTPGAMRAAATAFVERLDDTQRAKALLPLRDDSRRRFTYLPRPRPGICLADLDRAQRKAAHRLLATALSEPAYAQAATIMALEEVLDRQEQWRRGRHSNDFWIVIFGHPSTELWAWRWEGHHLSVTMTISGEQVYPTPLFLGANPATVTLAGHRLLRPLAAEEDLARALLERMGPVGRGKAIVADTAPPDIRAETSPHVDGPILPLGVSAEQLDHASRALLHQLTAVYLARLPPALSAVEAERALSGELHFAWEGPTLPGRGHYYRIQGADLLIEYDNTANDANHVHTVLRRPAHDFGGDALAAHRAAAHSRNGGHVDGRSET